MKFDAVLFDLGGVFTESPFDAMTSIADELGTSSDHLQQIIFGDYHQDTDHPWHRLERGEVSLGVARSEIMALGVRDGLEIDPFQLLGRIGTGGATRGLLITRTRELRAQGFKTALVTNNFAEIRKAWRRLLPLDQLFDVVVDSSEVGMRKPDPAIFEHSLSLLDARPERAIFLDDFEGNISAARNLGMHGILVDPDVPRVIRELDALLAST